MSANRVQQVFVELLELQDPIDWTEIRYQDTDGWDSLMHMAIVAELEERFDVMLETEDILNMSNYDSAIEILVKHGADIS